MERRLLGISIATVGTSECLVSQARKADLSHDGRVKMLPRETSDQIWRLLLLGTRRGKDVATKRLAVLGCEVVVRA